MLKRLSALVFVLAVAGQASAGVCNCPGFSTKKTHSCCKPVDSKVPVISTKGCCDPDCNVFGTQTADRSRIQASLKLTPIATGVVIEIPRMLSSAYVGLWQPVVFPIDQRFELARPPNLFILHHSFRI